MNPLEARPQCPEAHGCQESSKDNDEVLSEHKTDGAQTWRCSNSAQVIQGIHPNEESLRQAEQQILFVGCVCCCLAVFEEDFKGIHCFTRRVPCKAGLADTH